MSEEENKSIKSLNDFAYTIHGTLSVGEAKTILNLIKNLKQKNEELKHVNEQHRILNGELRKEINELKKQKQKILDYLTEE